MNTAPDPTSSEVPTNTPTSPPALIRRMKKPSIRKADWDAVHRDYRTGNYTLRELSHKYKITHQAISKKSIAEQWTQDLGEQINQATAAKLVQAAVDKNVHSIAETVLAAAEINKNVILYHRKGLQRLAALKDRLLDEIERTIDNLPEIEAVIEMAKRTDESGHDRLRDSLKRVMSRTAVIDDLRKLSEIDERVRKGEREAFNIAPVGSQEAQQDAKPRKRYLIDFVDVIDAHVPPAHDVDTVATLVDTVDEDGCQDARFVATVVDKAVDTLPTVNLELTHD
jgi:hypothetical protein